MELIELVNSIIIFFISNNLTQMVNFPTHIPECDSHSPALSDLSDTSICSAVVFPPLGNSDHVVVSVFFDFPSFTTDYLASLQCLMTILVLIGMVFVII